MGDILCHKADLPLHTAKGIKTRQAGREGQEGRECNLILWHSAGGIKAFINRCPHRGTPLDTFPDRFLTADKTTLICSTHGARFNTDGLCVSGACKGECLKAIAIKLKGDMISLA